MRQSSEQFADAMLLDDNIESTQDTTITDRIAELEKNMTNRINEMQDMLLKQSIKTNTDTNIEEDTEETEEVTEETEESEE